MLKIYSRQTTEENVLRNIKENHDYRKTHLNVSFTLMWPFEHQHIKRKSFCIVGDYGGIEIGRASCRERVFKDV